MYARHRFPTEIISYAVWLYNTFPLSYRDVQKLLLYRGIDVSHEATRSWCQKFGQQYANEIRRRRRPVGDKWHLDEVVITINAEKYYLWRVVLQHNRSGWMRVRGWSQIKWQLTRESWSIYCLRQ